MHPLELELQIAVSYLTWWWESDFRPLQEQCPLLTAELQPSISWRYCFKTYCPQYCKLSGQQASTHMENAHTLEIYQCFNCSVCQGGRGKQRMVSHVGLCPRLWIDGFCFVFSFLQFQRTCVYFLIPMKSGLKPPVTPALEESTSLTSFVTWNHSNIHPPTNPLPNTIKINLS